MDTTEIVMIESDEANEMRSSARDVVQAAAEGGAEIVHDSSLDDLLGDDEELETEDEDNMDEEKAEPNPMEMLNTMDGANQTYVPQSGEAYQNYGEDSYEVQQGVIQPGETQLSPDALQYEQQRQLGQFQAPLNPAPVFPPPNFDIPDISLSNSVTGGPGPQTLVSPAGRAMMNQQEGAQQSPVREGSSDSDDSIPLAQLATRRQVQAAQAAQFAAQSTRVTPVKKTRSPKKGKKKKDPNEPQKPVSAYAMFFRDTQAAIKSQNQNATFGEVSKIVASMWDNLGVDCKNVYKKKTEMAKKEYLKQLAVYRASLVSKQSPYEYPDQTGAVMNSPDVNKQLAQLQEMAQVASHLSSPSRLDGAMLSPQQQHMSPPQGAQQHMQHMSPTGQHMSPTGQHMSPTGQHMSPSGQHMSPSGQHMSPSGQHMSPTGQHMSPTGQHMSPNGPHMSPNGPHMSPNGAHMMPMGTHDPSQASPAQMVPGMDPNGYPMGVSSPAHQDQNGYCVRKGCQNTPLDGPNFDNTYCSNECVVTHCRDVFQNWVASRQSSYASVK